MRSTSHDNDISGQRGQHVQNASFTKPRLLVVSRAILDPNLAEYQHPEGVHEWFSIVLVDGCNMYATSKRPDGWLGLKVDPINRYDKSLGYAPSGRNPPVNCVPGRGCGSPLRKVTSLSPWPCESHFRSMHFGCQFVGWICLAHLRHVGNIGESTSLAKLFRRHVSHSQTW